MPLEEQFIKRNGELQQKVKEEIEKVKEGQSERNIVQLQTILSELQTSSRQKNIILSYPRIIIDSWDYSDYLGMELVELAELYKKNIILDIEIYYLYKRIRIWGNIPAEVSLHKHMIVKIEKIY